MGTGAKDSPASPPKWRIVAFICTLLALTASTIYLLITAPGLIGDFIRWQAANNNGQYYPKLTGGLIFIGLGIAFIAVTGIISLVHQKLRWPKR